MQHRFPWLAAGLGLVLALLLAQAMEETRTEPLLPPLMLLFISEFGFFLTLIGAWLGGRAWLAQRHQWSLLLISSACGIMALAFLYLGLALWSGLVALPMG
jgi:hypothetical protein